MTKDEALKLALEALEYHTFQTRPVFKTQQAITAIKEALAQDEQEPVAYDKTEMNGFVQDLYDKKMQEGKHGHYETMFHVVHQAIKRATPPQPEQEPWRESASDYERGFIDGMQKQAQSSVDKAVNRMAQRPWVGLTDEQIDVIDEATWDEDHKSWGIHDFARAIEAASKEKNT